MNFLFKRKVCEELLQGQITMPELARKYNLANGGTIYRWLKWYQEEQIELYCARDKFPHTKLTT